MEKTSVIREKAIIRTSIIGISANVMLVIFKSVIGIAVNSIAVILDAVNNLTDVFSSVVTIAGTKLAGKEPTKKHPYGYGRVEYMSQLIVAAIILYAGISSAVESVKKIISPEKADYSTVSLIIISAAVVVKLLLGFYVRKKGKEVKSGTLEASGSDALFDAVISFSVLVSAVIYMVSGISLEAWVGAAISVFIVKSGLGMIGEAVDEMLGHREEGELTRSVKSVVSEEEGVHGVYDLLLHDYGPDRHLASVHIEVDDNLTAKQIDAMSRNIQKKVYEETSVILTAVGIYSRNTEDEQADQMKQEIRKLVMSHDGVIQFHGFFADTENKSVSFDIIIDFSQDRKKLYEHIYDDVSNKYPDFTIRITLDEDIAD